MTALRHALARAHGDVRAAAHALGVSEPTAHRHVARLGLRPATHGRGRQTAG